MKTHRHSVDRASASARGWVLAFVATWMASSWARAGDVPRYDLTVGRELLYRSVTPTQEGTDEKGAKVTSNSSTEWTITVVDQNKDGSRRLVCRKTNVYSYSIDGKETKNKYSTNGQFDLIADGHLAEMDPIEAMEVPIELFPPLPPDAANLMGAWSATLGFDDTRRECKAAEPIASGADTWSFVEEPHTIFDLIQDRQTRRDYLFDLKQGAIRKATTATKWAARQGSDESVSVQSIELVGTRQLVSADVAALRDETGRFFAARAECDELTNRAEQDFAHTAEGFGRAEFKMKQLQGKFKLPALQAMLEEKLLELAGARRSAIEDADRFTKLIGKPSENWETTDLDDHPRSLEDYRGKIVLLDFWYRGCGWCIRAMPQVKQLADEFPADRVVVLGMNRDQNPDDARAVIEKMRLNYATLKDGNRDDGIHTKYGVHAWPTLVLLDGRGVIRNVHIGYTPTMGRDLKEMIHALLAEK
jgi:thiol-disulfide isomerase/thioredoxin